MKYVGEHLYLPKEKKGQFDITQLGIYLQNKNQTKSNQNIQYMKSISFKLILLITFLFFFKISISQNKGVLIQKNFANPENISKPLTWWHWINGNVTKEGIKKDLIDMKRVGIGGVQMFDTHMYLPKGPVRYGQDIWHEHVQYAIRMCDSLGMEFYMTNSPGWSGAGGPWISLEKSMKQLVYSETDANRLLQKEINLSSPYANLGFYKDITVIAIPALDGEEEIRKRLKDVTSSDGKPLKEVYDEDYSTGITSSAFKKGNSYILFQFSAPVAVNSITFDIRSIVEKIGFAGIIEVSNDGTKYKEINKFSFKDHIAKSANFTISFTSTKFNFLRIKFDDTKDLGKDIQLSEVKLRNLKNITDWNKRTGMSEAPFLNKNLIIKENFQGILQNQVIDLSKNFDPKTGNLVWKNMPEGRWTILRFGYTTTAHKVHPAVDEGTGYEVDKLDPDAVEFQFNQSLGRVIKEAGNLTGKTFKGILFDSFEGGFQNWTEKIPLEFQQRKGYDIKSYLPVLAGRTIETGFKSSAFLWDFQQALSDMFAENYYQIMQRLAHKNNLIVFSETQGGPMSPSNGNRFVDVPMNEFWTEGAEKREKVIKQTVSIANILGKNLVGAESFTSKPEFGKWQNLPNKLKKIGDYAFALGINKFIFHTYTHQPYEDILPGFTMGRYGTHFGRTNSWWKYAPEWGYYLGRSQYLLQQGKTVSDICYLFPNDAVYEFPSWITKIPEGLNYDIIYPQYLEGLKITGKELSLPSGARYKIMILPDYPYMTLETLKQLKALLLQGASLMGPPPISPPDMAGFTKGKAEFDQVVKDIWGDLNGKTKKEKKHGNGTIYWGKTIEDVLKENSITPDVVYNNTTTDSLKFIHKTGDNFDIYFITNQAESTVSLNLSLRVKGRQPEIWDALTGDSWKVPVFDTIGNRTNIPLQIDPQGSVFVVFRDNLKGDFANKISSDISGEKKSSTLPAGMILYNNKYLASDKAGFTIQGNSGKKVNINSIKVSPQLIIKTPWSLKFLDGRGAPESITMNALQLWNEHEHPDIRHYSGTAEYVNSFNLSANPAAKETALLEIDEIYDIAEVFINNQSAGVIWKKPFHLDITPYLKTGKNDIKILVVNRWINRLIGDEYIPIDAKYDLTGSKFSAGKLQELPEWLNNKNVERKDKRYTFATWKHYDKSSPLVKSGLFGKVRLVFFTELSY